MSGPVISAQQMRAILRANGKPTNGPELISARAARTILYGKADARRSIAVNACDLPIVLGGAPVTAARISHDVIRLVVPLTPSLNNILRWERTHNVGKLTKWHHGGYAGVRASMAQLWPGGLVDRPWADRIHLGVVRCTETLGRYDDDNAIAGVKFARDALIEAGIVVDDDDLHVTVSPEPVETRMRGDWRDLDGPATHLLIRRREKVDP